MNSILQNLATSHTGSNCQPIAIINNNLAQQNNKPALFMRWILALLMFVGLGVNAQSTANYAFTTNATNTLAADLNGNAIDMTTGTTSLVGAGLDATASAVTNIGFEFYFMGNRFSQFSVNEDGILQLGATGIGTNIYTLTGGTLAAPRLSAFNADMRTGTTTGKIHYKVVGAAPNRTLVVEFTNMQLFYTLAAAAGTSTWQMRLYETTGIVGYVYGTMNVSSIAAADRAPGIGFYTGAATNSFASTLYASHTNSVTSPYAANPLVAATGPITNLTSAANGSRRSYRYTPPTTTAPSSPTFTNVQPTTLTINWTNNGSNRVGTAVYLSTDNITFSYLGQATAAATSANITGLTANTTYFFNLYSVSEGFTGAPTNASQATTALVPLTGTKTIDNTIATGGNNFQTFTAAITSINVNGVGAGGVIFNVTQGQTFTEDVPALTATGTAVNTVVFQKTAGTNPVIRPTGTAGAADAGIIISGGDYITFDGIDINIATGSAVEYGYLVRNATATNGAQNNFIRNTTVTLNRANTSSIGILQTASTLSGGGVAATNATGANSNNKYYNLTIKNVYAGIYLLGTSATFPDLNCEIGSTACGTYNLIGEAGTANDIGFSGTATWGIKASFQSSVKIYNSEVQNVTTTAGVSTDGIFLDLSQGTSEVYNNKIHAITTTSTATTATVIGLRLSHNTTGTTVTRVYNNFIYEVRTGVTSTATTNRTVKGIDIASGGSATNSYEIYHNSVRIDNTTGPNGTSTAYEIRSASGAAFIVRNNIFANFTTSQTGVARHYGIVSTSATSLGNTGSSYQNNDIFIAFQVNTFGYTALGNSVNYNGVAAWQTANAAATNNIETDPLFTSIADLHSSSPVLNNGGTIAPAYASVDIDCQARSLTAGTNDIGADEFTVSGCTGAVGGTATGTTSFCASGTPTITATGYTIGLNTVYQWEYSNDNFVGDVHDLVGQTTPSALTTGPVISTTYYRLRVTCTTVPVTGYSNIVTVTINGLPTVTVSPNTASICQPGGTAVTLTASGAVSYTWTPTTGLTPTTGPTVSALPTVTTTYTATGTDVNGCVGTGTATITVLANPTGVTATATPANICTGGTSQLAAVVPAGLPNTYSFAGSTASYSTISGTTVTLGSVDDGYTGNLPIGFTFNYNGSSQTVFAASPNGALQLGITGSATSGLFSNALATNANIIAPLWDDNNLTGGNIQYLTTGTMGNRILTVQWTNMHVGGTGSTTNPTISMQVKLFEANGVIQIVYGTTSAALSGASASIGISGGIGNYVSVTPLSPANTSTKSTTSENSTISSAANFPSGTMYTFSPAAAGYTYSWSPAGDVVDPSIQTTLTNPLTATETFTVTVANGGCSVVASATVTVVSGAVITTDPSPIAVCAGATATFSVVATGPGITYQWRKDGVDINTVSNPSAATATLTLPTVTAADAATYDVVVTATCGSPVTSAGALLTVTTPLAGISTTPSTTICSGTSVTLTENGGNATSWSWAPGGATTQAITVSPLITTTYTVTATLNGCNATASQTITVNPTPSAVVITPASATICAGAIQQLTATGGSVSSNTTLISQNFNGANNWTTANASTSGTPANAAWTLRANGYVYSSTTFNSNDASQFYMSNSDAQGSGGVTSTTLTSPVISTVNFTSLSLSFFHYFRFNATPDKAIVEVSTNGGGSWTAVQTYVANVGTPTGFVNTVINMTPYVGNANVQIRFRYTASFGYYWAVDNVVVSGVQNVQGNVVWTPNGTGSGLYSDNLATSVYAGTATPTVYASPTATTTYTATSTTGACSSSANVTVNVNPLANAGTVTGTTPLCVAGTATYASTGDAGGTWSSTNTGVASVDATTGLVTAVAAGTTDITYSVTNGCGTVSAFQTLTISPNANAGTVTGPTPLCSGNTAPYTSTGDAGGTWSSTNTGVAIVNPSTGDVTAMSAGTADITYTVTNSCGTASAFQTLTVSPNANAGTVSGTRPLCIGATATYTSTGDAGGTWSSTNTAIATVDATTGLVTAVATGTTDITYTVGTGCNPPASAFLTLTVSPNANSGTVTGNTPLCIGQPATYLSNGDLGFWSSSNPAVATVDFNTGAITTNSAGTTDITYTVGAGCNSPVSSFQTLTVSPNANAGTITGTTPLAVAATATYTSDGDAGGTWSSTDPAVASVNATTGLVTALSAGTTDITYTVNTGCNAPVSAFQTLTVTANANAGTVTGTTPLCVDATATYTSDGDAGGTWSSTNPGVATVDATTGVVTAISAGTTDITYTVAGTTSSFQTLTVNPNANAGTVSGTSPLCAGGTATYTSTGDAGGIWSSTNPGVASVDATTGVVTAIAAGTTDITYTVTNSCGTASDFQTLTVNPNANAGTVSGTSPLCAGGTATYTSTGDAGGTWSSTNTVVATVNATTGVVTAVSAGTTDITYTVTNSCGTASAFQTLTVNANVNAGTVTGTSPLCIGATATYSSNGDAGGSWSSNNTGVATVDANTGVVTGVAQGTANITYTVTGVCGGPATALQSVTVQAIDYANLQFPASGAICSSGSLTAYGQVYEPGVTEAGGQGAGITVEIGYNTSNTNPATWTNWSAAGFNGQSGNNDEYVAAIGNGFAPGTYYYTFRYSLNGCAFQYGGYNSGGGGFWNGTSNVNGVLTVNPDANAGTVSGTSPLCAGATATYSSTGDAGGSWSSTNTAVATVNSTTGLVTAVGAGSTNITYTISTGCATPVSAFQALSVITGANAGTVSGTSPLCIGATATYTSNGDAGGTWSSNNTSVATVDVNTGVVTGIAQGSANITYTVIGVCGSATASQSVSVQAIDYANLQFPASGTICSNGSLTAYGQVYEPGVTEAGGQGAGITVEIGYNTSNTNPATWTNWSAAGFNGQSGNNDEYVAVIGNGFAPGTYYYTFRYSLNGCAFQYGGYSSGGGGFWNGTSNVSGVLTVNPDANAGTVSGTSPLCVGATATYTSTGDAGGTWSSTNTAVATVNGSTGVVTAVSAGTTDITYTVTNSCGTASAFQSLTVNPNANAGTVSGTSPLCVAATATYTSTGDAGGTWSSTNTGVATVNPTTGLVTAVTAGTTDITYTATNSCGTASAFQTLTVNPNANAGTVSGTTPLAVGANATYSSTGDAGGTWSSTNTGVATVNASTGVVTAVAAGTTDITYTVTNSCGTASAFQTLTVNGNTYTITSSATANGSISPNGVTVVSSGANQTYTITPAACYHVDDVLVDGLSAGAVTTYTFTNVTANHTISASFALNAPLALPVVTGPVNVCSYVGTGTPVTYTFNSPGATGYSYTLPPTNVSLVSSTANSITITFGSAFRLNGNKQIRVRALSPCGNSDLLVFVLVALAPPTPQPIVGTSSVCPVIGTSNTLTYTIPSVAGATSYIWTAQAGTTTITHPNGLGVNDTTVNVSFTSGFTSSTITVASANDSCGASNTRSFNLVKANPSTPGVISGSTNACAYMAPGGVPATYSVSAIAGNTYTWTVPANVTGLTGQGTNSISFTYPDDFVSGSVTVTATNGCGTSGSRSLSITKLLPSTPGVIDVIQEQPCPDRIYSYSLSKAPGQATSIVWTVPAGATIISGQGTISIMVSYPPTSFNSTVTVQGFSNCGSSTIRSTPVLLPTCPEGRSTFTKGESATTAPATEALKVNVYPNPTVSDFKLQVVTAGKQTITVRILDAQGRSFKTFEILPYQTINVGSDLKAGAYMMEVRQGNEVKVTKLLKF